MPRGALKGLPRALGLSPLRPSPVPDAPAGTLRRDEDAQWVEAHGHLAQGDPSKREPAHWEAARAGEKAHCACIGGGRKGSHQGLGPLPRPCAHSQPPGARPTGLGAPALRPRTRNVPLSARLPARACARTEEDEDEEDPVPGRQAPASRGP